MWIPKCSERRTKTSLPFTPFLSCVLCQQGYLQIAKKFKTKSTNLFLNLTLKRLKPGAILLQVGWSFKRTPAQPCLWYINYALLTLNDPNQLGLGAIILLRKELDNFFKEPGDLSPLWLAMKHERGCSVWSRHGKLPDLQQNPEKRAPEPKGRCTKC